jgi:hypothetical protein
VPLEGWRHVKVIDRHTAIDYAHALKDLAEVNYPLCLAKERIVPLLCD